MLNPSELIHVNIIGSDDYERAVLGLVLGARDYRVRSFCSLDELALPRHEPGGTCALLALSRREVESEAMLQSIRQLSLHLPILLLIDQTSHAQLAAAVVSDHISLLVRPVQKDVLLRSIQHAIRSWLESEIA